MDIDVIIRISNNEKVIKRTLDGIVKQEGIEIRFIIVYNNSFDKTLGIINSYNKENVVIKYPDEDFSYSKALNLAIPHIKAKYTLVISSHSVINNIKTLSYAIEQFNKDKSLVACVCAGHDMGFLNHTVIDLHSFNGWNGAWNTATLYNSEKLVQQPFSEALFICEDQYWSNYWLKLGFKIIHIFGCGREYNNLNFKVSRKVKEWDAISYFLRRDYLESEYILHRLNIAIFQSFTLRSLHFNFYLTGVLIKNKIKIIIENTLLL